MPRRARPKGRVAPPRRDLSPAEEAGLARAVAPVTDPALALALASLGRSIKARQPAG